MDRRGLGRNQNAPSEGLPLPDSVATPICPTGTSIGRIILKELACDVKGSLSVQKVELCPVLSRDGPGFSWGKPGSSREVPVFPGTLTLFKIVLFEHPRHRHFTNNSEHDIL
jgi:hypothetical protein